MILAFSRLALVSMLVKKVKNKIKNKFPLTLPLICVIRFAVIHKGHITYQILL